LASDHNADVVAFAGAAGAGWVNRDDDALASRRFLDPHRIEHFTRPQSARHVVEHFGVEFLPP
jgi:hypothetical protein